jgi:prophage regulatory protein
MRNYLMSLSVQHHDPLWHTHDLCHQVDLSRSTIYRLIDNNDFPKPIPLGSKSIGFLSSEVIAWKEQRITESRKEKDA